MVKIYIKNMVCDRCTMAVRNLLDDMGMAFNSIVLGEVDLDLDGLDDHLRCQFSERLQQLGFELIDNRKAQIIDKIKLAVIELVKKQEGSEKIRLSEFVKERLHHDYSHLSHLFSLVEGVTLEQYFILQKIEKVKELLIYDELSISEISYKLGYSSVAHLSGQFKKITGMTPGQFKKNRGNHLRKPLDKI